MHYIWKRGRWIEGDVRNLLVLITLHNAYREAFGWSEGEHKIMEYIRLQRTCPEHDPNTRHVIHGLDADLIMLGLATHEPHFYILREEVTVGNATKQVAEEIQPAKEAAAAAAKVDMDISLDAFAKPFQFVKLAVVREYLAVEFSDADFRSVGGMDLERVVDDFVMMCFFVGNDFLPHLPSLDIREGAIDTIMDTYKFIFPELGGYLTSDCELNMNGVRAMMKEIAQLEDEFLQRRRQKEQRFEQRRNSKKQNIRNKENSKRHLALIRQLTASSAAHAVPLGLGMHAEPSNAPPAKRSRVIESDAPAHLDHTSVEAFRIKNRSPGGIRTLAPGASERDAKKLHVMDKIREIADGTAPGNPKKVELKNLSNAERACAHEYCEELGLGHDSKGTEPNRYIVVSRSDMTDEDRSQMTAEERKEHFSKALSTAIRDQNDKVADAQVDEVDLGRSGWKDRYYKTKLPEVDPLDVAEAYIAGLSWVFKYYYTGCQSWNWFFPYHYAPFAEDLQACIAARNRPPKLELGAPFKPYEQLMSVFPASSGSVLNANLLHF